MISGLVLSFLLSVHGITPSSNKFAIAFTSIHAHTITSIPGIGNIADHEKPKIMAEHNTTGGDVNVDVDEYFEPTEQDDHPPMSKNAVKKQLKKVAVEKKKIEKAAIKVSE